MAAKKKSLQRTVSFWRLVRAIDGEKFEPIDWPSVMAELVKKGPKIRHDVEGVDLSGTVHTRGDVDHLVLTKNRDGPKVEHHHRSGGWT